MKSHIELFSLLSKRIRKFLHVVILKRKKNNFNKNEIKEHRYKIIRIIIVFITQDIIDQTIITKYDFVIINNKIFDKLVIFVFKT